MIVIHHNRDCGTSRNVLRLIEATGEPFEVVDYLREGWTRPQLLGLFAAADEVRGGIDSLVRGVRDTMRPVRGYEEASLPGTVEQRMEQEYRRDGVPVGERGLTILRETAEEFGVDLPPPVRWRDAYQATAPLS